MNYNFEYNFEYNNVYHCMNCNSDYDSEKQFRECPHEFRSEGVGTDRIKPWPKGK